MSKKSKVKAADRRTLSVKFNNNSHKRVVIPAGCKVTFGPLCPGSKGEHNGNHGIALRIYSPT